MSPSTGQPAPHFQARSDDGRLIDLAELRGRWVVLYFYPRAGTPGCSIEAQRFEQALPEFGRLGAEDDLRATLQVEGELRSPGAGRLTGIRLEDVHAERVDAEQHRRDDEQAEEDSPRVASRG